MEIGCTAIIATATVALTPKKRFGGIFIELPQ
jgi:hypothetical protein